MSNTNKIKTMRIKIEKFIVQKMIDWSHKILARQCKELGVTIVDAQEIIKANNEFAGRIVDIK